MAARLCSSIAAITGSSCQHGTKMAIRFSGAWAGAGGAEASSDAAATKRSSRPLMRIAQASGVSKAVTRASIISVVRRGPCPAAGPPAGLVLARFPPPHTTSAGKDRKIARNIPVSYTWAFMEGDEVCFLSARALAEEIRHGRLSARETVAAHLQRIEAVNPKLNAIVTLVSDRAMEQASAADESQSHGELTGPLHGLPVAHKDLQDMAGIRTTYGSRVFRDHVPDLDSPLVERLRKAGAIAIGKSNTPEFGAGSQTFNEVFGVTRNPYDLTKTPGGSSGGAAVALACGMVPLADGSDMGGSLRNPASFCNVVGFRTAPGRVPVYPVRDVWSPFSVEGPLARTVADVACFLSAMAGPDLRCPVSTKEPGSQFVQPLDRDFK